MSRTLWALTSVWRHAIHYYSIIERSSSSPQIACVFPLTHPLLSPPTPTATNLFNVPVLLPFPECQVVATIAYVAFPDWLLSLSNMHLRFLHNVFWLVTHFFLSHFKKHKMTEAKDPTTNYNIYTLFGTWFNKLSLKRHFKKVIGKFSIFMGYSILWNY